MRSALLVACVTLVGCAASPAMQAAKSGDRAALAREIDAHEKKGDLSNDDAAALGRAVAEREIRTAKTPAEAAARVNDVASCAKELHGVLEDRMETHDEAGAAAALALFESDALDDDDARAFAGDKDEKWRAVGARALFREEDGNPRRRALVDASPLVRRQAARAARIARDGADLVPLAEMARLDPEPLARTDAVRALAAQPANSEVASRLRDLWTAAAGDEGLREDIATAYAEKDVFDHGGREALVVLLGQSKDEAAAIEAAAAVERGLPASQPLDAEARAVVLRALDEGSARAKLQAIAVAKLEDAQTLAAVKKASDDPDEAVKVAANARLLELPQTREGAQRALETIGGQDRTGPLGSRARFALAAAGDARIQQWIEDDLHAPDAYTKLAAASALAALGHAGRAAPLLADQDASVRARAACTLIMAVRR